MAQNIYYQRGLRKLLSTPTEERAIPTTEETTMTHVGGKAKEEAILAARSKSRVLRRQKLADVVGLRKERLSIQKEQGRKATAIQLGNLALTGMGGYRNIQTAQRQSTMFDEMVDLNKQLLDIKRRHYASLMALK